MDDPDYLAASLSELAGELDRLARKRAPTFELYGALSRYETVLLRLAERRHRPWVAREIHRLATRHNLAHRADPPRLND